MVSLKEQTERNAADGTQSTDREKREARSRRMSNRVQSNAPRPGRRESSVEPRLAESPARNTPAVGIAWEEGTLVAPIERGPDAVSLTATTQTTPLFC